MSRDSERLKTLGRSGRDKAIKRFNWDTLAGEYESLFQQLCARLPPREDAVVREQRG
jgi:hypothetical protein